MERDFASAHLQEEDFRRLRALVGNDPKLPKDYAGWVELVRRGTRQSLAEGSDPADVVIDLKDFTEWCARVGVQVCFDALRAYLIVQRRGGADLQTQKMFDERAARDAHKRRDTDESKRAGRLEALIRVLEQLASPPAAGFAGAPA
jgi:hypothetical protein